MSEDWLKNWYKDNFTKSSAPKIKDETWEKIDAQLGDWTGMWYKSNSEELDLKPSASVWENLSANLPQQAAAKVFDLKFLLRAASISLLFISIPYLLLDTTATENVQNSTTIQVAEISEIPSVLPIKSIDAPTRVLLAEVSSEASSVIPSPVDINPDFFIEPASNLELAQTKIEADAPVSKLNILPLMSMASEDSQHSLQASRKNPPRFGKWSFGVTSNLQHSNYLNPISAKGLDSESSVTNMIHSSTSVSISAYRKLRNNHSLKFTAVVNDKKTQSYKDFVASDYIEKSLSMNYQTFSVSFVQPLFTNTFHGRFGVEAYTGLYGSFRTQIEEKWGDQDRFVMTEGFKKFDLGVNVGLDGVLSLSNKIDLSTGFYYSNGLINVFNGTSSIPARFLKTFTTSFGASVGLRYHL